MTQPISQSPAADEAGHSLRRTLGLRDLVPMQILIGAGIYWRGTRLKARI